jgi:hypothetical protein
MFLFVPKFLIGHMINSNFKNITLTSGQKSKVVIENWWEDIKQHIEKCFLHITLGTKIRHHEKIFWVQNYATLVRLLRGWSQS